MENISHRPTRVALVLALIAGSLLCLLPLRAESDYVPLSAEAASSLFDLDLGGNDAQLLVKGSWNAGLTGQAGLVLKDGITGLSSDTNLLFTQTPDLYLSFLLFNHLFVDARVSNDIAQTRYAVGWRGGKGEFLRDLRVGNYGISFPVLPFLSMGAGSYRSFGAAASFAAGEVQGDANRTASSDSGGLGLATAAISPSAPKAAEDAFSGRFMLRYDQATRVEKKFVGGKEVKETSLPISAFLRGKWLVAPDTGFSKPKLYIQSSSGSLAGSDSLSYRRAESSEFSYSSSTGLISLGTAAKTKVLVSYVVAAGMTTTGLPTVTIDGETCVVLFDPAVLDSPTQALGRYSLSVSDGMKAFVRDNSTGLKDPSYEVELDGSGGFAAVYHAASGSGATDPQKKIFRQPFSSSSAAYIYSTDFSDDAAAQAYTPALPYTIIVRSYTSTSKIAVDTDLVEGSVEVTRNGLPEYGFTVDKSGGILSLANPPGLEEEIVVSYLKESSTRSTGSLAAGLGGIFNFGQGRSAWTALGMRWSMPGTSYASSGVADSGRLVFTLGEKDEAGDFRQNFALGASWGTKVASGSYRLEGMESASSNYETSFWAFENTGAFSVAEERESSLSASFPSLVSKLHADSSAQKALHAVADKAGEGGDLLLAKYIDEVPVSSLKTFSFFARSLSGGASGNLTIALDEGSGSSLEPSKAAILVSIPASALSGSWQRFVFRYGYGETSRVYCQSYEDGSLTALASLATSPHYDSSLSSARRLVIRFEGAAAGDEVWLDEFMFEESSGQASLLASGGLSYEKADLLLGPEAFPLLKGLKVSADATGGLANSSYASGGASLESSIGPLGLKVQTRAALTDSEASFRGGHTIVVPSFPSPLSLSDSFSVDPASGDFGREDKLGLALGSWLNLNASEKSTWSGSDADFAQVWEAGCKLLGGSLAASLSASNASNPNSFPGLIANYFESWTQAWQYALPSFEDSSTKRAATLGLSAGFGDREVASLKMSVAGLPASTSNYRDDLLLVRLQVPLKFGKDLALVPYYQREWTARLGGAGSGLVNLVETCAADAFGFTPLWQSLPFSEIVDSDDAGFKAFSSVSEASKASKSSLVPEFGLALARNYGSTWTDLLIPSSLSLALQRDLEKEGDSLSSALAFTGAAKFGAINLFGSLGSYPLSSLYESDDYSANYKASLAFYEGESRPRLSFVLQHVATLYGNGNRDSLAFDNRLSVSDEPAKSSWSETLNLSLSLLKSRSWLLDLYNLVLLRFGPAAKPAVPDGANRPRLSSGYLAGLAATPPLARDIVSIAATASSTTTDKTAGKLDISAKEGWEFKLTVPQKLSFSVKPFLSQLRDGDSLALTLDAALYIGATISW
jgi:hypothetical protein